MAKSAVTDLTDHIETIRQEAYKDGYAAAMRAVVEFSGSGTAKSKATRAKATTAKPTTVKPTTGKSATARVATAKATIAKPATASEAAPRRQRRAQAEPTSRQTRRGDNARHIAEAMMMLPDHSGPAAAIKKVLVGRGTISPIHRSDMDWASYKLVARYRSPQIIGHGAIPRHSISAEADQFGIQRQKE